MSETEEQILESDDVASLSSVLGESTSDLTKIAQEVIAGHWGRGLRRNAKLVAAGYSPVEVSNEVYKILNPS